MFESLDGAIIRVRSVLEKTLSASLVILVFVFVASCFLAMLLGLDFLLFTSEGRAVSSRVYPLPIFLFTIVQLRLPITLSLGALFFFVWSAYLLCFAAAWMWRESFHCVLGKAFRRPTNKLLSNFLFALPVLASTLLLGIISLQFFQESVGVPTGEPALPKNPFETFFLLAYSPIAEEVGFRISPIGLFLIVHVFVAGRKAVTRMPLEQLLKLFLTAPFYPEKAKRIVGLKTVDANGFKGISMAEWIMVFLTSLIFGLAHFFSGFGWEVGKVTSTFIAGLVFGLAYLAYGFQAPILLHWYFNYYFYTFELAADLYPSMVSVETLILLLTTTSGILGFLILLVAALGKILMKKGEEGNRLSFRFESLG
jgi:membrane protease YdiL (CAAX protease family)